MKAHESSQPMCHKLKENIRVANKYRNLGVDQPQNKASYLAAVQPKIRRDWVEGAVVLFKLSSVRELNAALFLTLFRHVLYFSLDSELPLSVSAISSATTITPYCHVQHHERQSVKSDQGDPSFTRKRVGKITLTTQGTVGLSVHYFPRRGRLAVIQASERPIIGVASIELM